MFATGRMRHAGIATNSQWVRSERSHGRCYSSPPCLGRSRSERDSAPTGFSTAVTFDSLRYHRSRHNTRALILRGTGSRWSRRIVPLACSEPWRRTGGSSSPPRSLPLAHQVLVSGTGASQVRLSHVSGSVAQKMPRWCQGMPSRHARAWATGQSS
jgi:hypothetical protein